MTIQPNKNTYIMAAGLLLVFFLIDMCVGSFNISLDDVLGLIFGRNNISNSSLLAQKIIVEIRLPRVLTAVCAGAGLSVAGLLLQTLFRNPLVDATILGVSSGASLGVAALMFGVGILPTWTAFGLHSGLVVLASVTGALLVTGIILLISVRVKNNTALLLVGLMISSLTFSLVSIWQYMSDATQIKSYLLWTFGSFEAVNSTTLPYIGFITIFTLFFTIFLAKPLNILLIGDLYAKNLGVDILRVRVCIILTASVLSGTITAFCGPVSFVGMAVPQIVRQLLHSNDHAKIIPLSALFGAIFLLFCDIIIHLQSLYTLPLNALTSLLGAPVMIWTLLYFHKSYE
jgi:iron complex transport system permease protein